MVEYVRQCEEWNGIFQIIVVLCKVTLVGTCIERRKEANGGSNIKSVKLRDKQYKEEFVRSLEKDGIIG